jgi:hypothetical protein
VVITDVVITDVVIMGCLVLVAGGAEVLVEAVEHLGGDDYISDDCSDDYLLRPSSTWGVMTTSVMTTSVMTAVMTTC